MNSPWFVTFAQRPQARRRLVCIPYAGGAASAFRAWPPLVSPDVEIVAIQLPGRWTRRNEPPFRRIAPLVAALAEAFGPIADRPFALFGHSFGALVAFELARLLPSTSQPTHLFVSARRAPNLAVSGPPVRDLDDATFVREVVERYQGVPAQVLNEPDLLALLLPALRADMEAFETYQFVSGPPLDIPLTAFSGLDDPNCPSADVARWREHTTAVFAHHTIQGGHFYTPTVEREVVHLIDGALRVGET